MTAKEINSTMLYKKQSQKISDMISHKSGLKRDDSANHLHYYNVIENQTKISDYEIINS